MDAALEQARVGTVIYGADEPKSGALVSAVRAHETPGLNHRFQVVSGVREAECRDLIQRFFQERRRGGREAVRETPPTDSDVTLADSGQGSV